MGVGVTAGYFLFYKYENKGNTRGGGTAGTLS